MTAAYRKRWLAVGLVWVAATVLAWWNFQSIADVAAAREAWQSYSSSQAYVESRALAMASANEQVEQLSLPVESAAFGLLTLQEELTRLGTRHGLSSIKFDSKADLATRDMVPLAVSFDGTLSAATQWVAALQGQLPYLAVDEMRVEGAGDEVPSFTLHLTLRIRTVNPSGEGRSKDG